MNVLLKILITTCLITACLFMGVLPQMGAEPTGAYWTVCNTDVVDTHTTNICVVNYFQLFHHHSEQPEMWPIDVGLTYGLFTWNDMKAEIGIDYITPTRDPVYFNAKVGIDEEKLFPYSPGMSVGIFDVGTKTHGPNKTNQDIVNVCFSKSLPDAMMIGGRVTVGGFGGNHAMGKNRVGVMLAYNRAFCAVKDASGTEYNKWGFIADYATGKNTGGGGGFGVTCNFTPTINITTGPTWFNDHTINGSWQWTIQLSVSV